MASGAVSSLSLSLTLAGFLVFGLLVAPQPVLRSKRVVVATLMAVALVVGTSTYAFNIVNPCNDPDVSWYVWITYGCYLP